MNGGNATGMDPPFASDSAATSVSVALTMMIVGSVVLA